MLLIQQHCANATYECQEHLPVHCAACLFRVCTEPLLVSRLLFQTFPQAFDCLTDHATLLIANHYCSDCSATLQTKKLLNIRPGIKSSLRKYTCCFAHLKTALRNRVLQFLLEVILPSALFLTACEHCFSRVYMRKIASQSDICQF